MNKTGKCDKIFAWERKEIRYIDYKENELTFADYVLLRNSVGWNHFDDNQMNQAVQNSLYTITVLKEQQTVAMGRLIGDGMYYLIADIIVKLEYQKQGIGSRIIDMILKYIEDRTPAGGRSSVQLIAEKGKETFYKKKGFKLIPHEFCGFGMRKIIQK